MLRSLVGSEMCIRDRDALLQNLADVKPSRVHADTHGQSAAVFGLAYLLGIELMPRIRRWQSLLLYRSDSTNRYSKINSLSVSYTHLTLPTIYSV